jgi:hypothetical protein
LIVTNGDGQGTDEVRSYEVFLNGERVVPTDHSRNTQAAVKLRATNTLKVVLSGAPHSKVFVLFAYAHVGQSERSDDWRSIAVALNDQGSKRVMALPSTFIRDDGTPQLLSRQGIGQDQNYV